MKKIIFSKFSAAGNDFVLIDKSENPGLIIDHKMIIELCDRKFGIGADGVLIYSDNSIDEINIEYFNSDGSGGSLCGNGSRCAAKYFFDKENSEKEKVKILNLGKVYTAEKINPDLLKFGRFRVNVLKQNVIIENEEFKLSGIWIDTGSPHFVVNFEEFFSEKEKLKLFDFEKVASKIRGDKVFGESGTNVIFIQKVENEYYIRSFEKGVESETLSCGSGTVAAAIYCALKFDVKSPVNFNTIRNFKLTVNFERINNNFESVFLTGPAKNIFNGEIII